MNPLISLVSTTQVAIALPQSADDELLHRGILAGLLSASQALFPPDEFQRLVTECTIDPIDLAALLALAQPETETKPTIEV